MEELIEILEDIQPDADYETCETLIDDGILDSFAILSIITELQDEYDIRITPAEIVPANFNSAKAIYAMVKTPIIPIFMRGAVNGKPIWNTLNLFWRTSISFPTLMYTVIWTMWSDTALTVMPITLTPHTVIFWMPS